MKSIYSPVTLLVALAAPLAVLAGDYDNVDVTGVNWDEALKGKDWSGVDFSGGNGQPDAAAQAAAAAAASSSSAAAAAAASSSAAAAAADGPVVVQNLKAKPIGDTNNKASTTPSTAPSSSTKASPPASSTSASTDSSNTNPGDTSNGGDSSPTTCQSSTGMMIEWTSNSETVPWSFSGGSGQTKPGSCTDLGNFSGQLAINGLGGTIFEGNYNGGDQYFDVSYIIGYSASMMCSSSLGKSGCSIDLTAQGHPCPQKGAEDHICTNPNGSNGNNNDGGFKGDMGAFPWCLACSGPDPFFQACAGSAYTYPYDDFATQHANKGETIKCCIGSKCGETGREGKTKHGLDWPQRNPPCMPCKNGPAAQSKREVGEVAKESKREVLVEDFAADMSKREIEEVFERGARDMTPKLLKRGHKHRHSHVHAKKAGRV